MLYHPTQLTPLCSLKWMEFSKGGGLRERVKTWFMFHYHLFPVRKYDMYLYNGKRPREYVIGMSFLPEFFVLCSALARIAL